MRSSIFRHRGEETQGIQAEERLCTQPPAVFGFPDVLFPEWTLGGWACKKGPPGRGQRALRNRAGLT